MVKTREIKLFITLHHVTRKCNIGEYANKMSTHTSSMTITAITAWGNLLKFVSASDVSGSQNELLFCLL